MVIDLHVLRVSSPDLALHLSKPFVDWAGLFAAIGAKQSIASALRGAPLVAVPFYYIHRNLRARRVTTLLTIGGMALVVFVFATMRMLAEGIKQTLVDTGRGDNVMVIRRSAETEVQSSVDREQAAIVESLPHIAQGAAGERYASKESSSCCRSAGAGSLRMSRSAGYRRRACGCGRRFAWFKVGCSGREPRKSLPASRSPKALAGPASGSGSDWAAGNGPWLGSSMRGIVASARRVNAGVSPQRILLGDFPAGRPAYLRIRTAKDQ